MDDEQVLRSLGSDLERNDPRLAAMLSGARPHRFHPAWFLVTLPLLGGLLFLPVTTAVGVLALLLVTASPLAAFLVPWETGGGAAPRH